MKALSLQQPWAWLMVNGIKDIENRSWPTHRRGRVLVHASKRFDREGYEWIREHFPALQMPGIDHFERGGIVGEFTITGCVDEHPSPWFFGPYGFTVTGARPLPFEPCKGMLGFFEPNIECNMHQKGTLL